EPARHGIPRRIGGIRRAITADPGIHANALAHPSAKQLADRSTQRLALDVPKRLIDAGDGTHVQGTAAVEAAAVHDRPEVFDVSRITTDQVVGQLLHHRGDALCTAFDHRLAPAGDAFIGLDLEEQPAWRHDQRGEAGYFH